MKNKILYKPILFTVGVHGDEHLPVKLVQSKLEPKDYLICNQKALKNDVRFIESDLNRSFPGKINGTLEEKLAQKILLKIKNNYIVDFHTAKHVTPPFIIITKVSSKHFSLASKTGLKKIVIMNRNFGAGTSLIDFAKVGISIESGREKSIKTEKIIFNIIDQIQKNQIQKINFQVFTVIKAIYKTNKGEFLTQDVKSFKLIKSGNRFTNLGRIAETDFYPILARSNYPNFLYLMAKKINYQKLNVKL